MTGIVALLGTALAAGFAVAAPRPTALRMEAAPAVLAGRHPTYKAWCRLKRARPDLGRICDLRTLRPGVTASLCGQVVASQPVVVAGREVARSWLVQDWTGQIAVLAPANGVEPLEAATVLHLEVQIAAHGAHGLLSVVKAAAVAIEGAADCDE